MPLVPERTWRAGRALASDTAIKSKQWCSACGTAVWPVRPVP
jgi:hypothetical protein